MIHSLLGLLDSDQSEALKFKKRACAVEGASPGALKPALSLHMTKYPTLGIVPDVSRPQPRFHHIPEFLSTIP